MAKPKLTSKVIGKPEPLPEIEPVESSSKKSEYENHPKFDKFKTPKGVNQNGN